MSAQFKFSIESMIMLHIALCDQVHLPSSIIAVWLHDDHVQVGVCFIRNRMSCSGSVFVCQSNPQSGDYAAVNAKESGS